MQALLGAQHSFATSSLAWPGTRAGLSRVATSTLSGPSRPGPCCRRLSWRPRPMGNPATTTAASASASTDNGTDTSNNNHLMDYQRRKQDVRVEELPLEAVRRPLRRTRANDEQKVLDLMESIQQIGLQVPIDVLEVDGKYYGFSGCHRYEAHQRLGMKTIKCRVRKATQHTLKMHMM
eukprot:jgi/Chlat1/7331/Chrsp59S06969